ncbi:MAG: hypothetical protein WAV93_05875 [Bacteroidales bacterium]
MKRTSFSIQLFLLALMAATSLAAQDSLLFRGQVSGYTHLNSVNAIPWWSGGRYIPRMNYRHTFDGGKLLDTELSANLFGNIGLDPFRDTVANGHIKPCRLWVRYSGEQFELRAGLQKINFGSQHC